MKNLIIAFIAVMMLSACTELELGSHFAKGLNFPSDKRSTVGDFKVGNPYEVKGRTYVPTEEYSYSETGMASWYGPGFEGKRTANGELFRRGELTAAHKTLQMPSIARVTNLDNGRSIIVRINDRGPFSDERLIDVSEKAAELLGMKGTGTARVRVDVLEKESRQVASAAKNGISTRGTEVALNRGEELHKFKMAVATPVAKPKAIAAAHAARQSTQPVVLAGYSPAQSRGGFDRIVERQASVVPVSAVAPSASVTQVRFSPSKGVITAPQTYYIQAGVFHSEDNALTMKSALYNVKEPIKIVRGMNRGQPVYGVKIGPVSGIEKANEILTLLNRQGREARLVMAQN